MIRLIGILILTVILSSCSMNKIPDSFIPKEADKLANDYLDSLFNGNLDYCFEKLSEGIKNEDTKNFNLSIYEFLKDKKLISKRIISSNTETLISENTSKYYNLSYEYQFSDSLWEYFDFKISEKNNQLLIVGFNILPQKQSLDKINEFTFKNKSFINYIWIFFAILVPIFIIISLIYAIKTPLKKKWLWIIFILFGFIAFSLNWTTGEFAIQLINIKLFGAGIVKSGIIAPWIISFSIPIGAIIFWIKRKKIMNEIENNEK